MVVWQGITAGGTAVPVQITEEGKVVALGEAGPEGPEGPEGPPGPPGEGFETSNDPFEGAFLSYEDGSPLWVPRPSDLPGSQVHLIDRVNVDQEDNSTECFLNKNTWKPPYDLETGDVVALCDIGGNLVDPPVMGSIKYADDQIAKVSGTTGWRAGLCLVIPPTRFIIQVLVRRQFG